MSTTFDDLAVRLPQIDFVKKKVSGIYNQRMQSLRGGRVFYLRTVSYTDGTLRLSLREYGERPDQVLFIAERKAVQEDSESITKAIKSLERKAGCKLYYVLLIDTDGNYL